MNTVTVDFAKTTGRIKPMHGVNSGPFQAGTGLGDKQTFAEAGFPCVRNHDSSCSLFYFGERAHDVNFIFRDFDADENDPANYDFHYTDRFCRDTMTAGATMLFRLGSKIEGGDKKYNTLPPKDFAKYARICEHIMAHYCSGWADGYEFPFRYWEIWCEADNYAADGTNKCWGGTFEQFLEFYEIMAKHLKKAFPDRMIGGPAFTHSSAQTSGRNYMEEFVRYAQAHDIPMDFCSWHNYTTDVDSLTTSVHYTRDLLNRYGYQQTEVILDEWNYVGGWRGAGIAESYNRMQNEIGAAFYSAAMLGVQKTELDMLMYYDVRPDCSFNGLFKPYTFEPLKGYYSFWQFNKLYQLKNEVYSESNSDNFYVGAAADGTDAAVQVAYYRKEDGLEPAKVQICLKNLPVGASLSCVLTDRDHTNETLWTVGGTSDNMTVSLDVQPYSTVFLKIGKAEE